MQRKYNRPPAHVISDETVSDRARSGHGPARPAARDEIRELQKQAGNRATQQYVQRLATDPQSSGARSGMPLQGQAKSELESAFTHDLGHVKLHSDASATNKTGAADAFAVTEGADIYLSPEVDPSKGLASNPIIAHEVAHVVQQTRSGTAQPQDDVARDEREADAAAWAALSSSPTSRISGLSTLISVGRSVLRPRSCSRRPTREEMGRVVTRADQITQAGAAAMPGEFGERLQRASRATSFARTNVGRFNNVMDNLDRAQRVAGAVRALNALQSSSGAFSDGRAAARQFDILFAALGEILESSGVPGAAQYGTLLKSVGNFFENMEGLLNPTRRWQDRPEGRYLPR
jgi:hypothetical protein